MKTLGWILVLCITIAIALMLLDLWVMQDVPECRVSAVAASPECYQGR